MINVTKHAEQRMKERCGFNKRSLERMAQKAYDKGVNGEKTVGKIKSWVCYLSTHDDEEKDIRLYGDKCYIYANNTLITVLQIPQKLVSHPSYTKLRQK